jgi:selenocysteine lyase/cysteine desulfurase
VDAVHYGPHGPIDVGGIDADVLVCSPYKYYAPHMGLAFARRELLRRWRPYKARPAPGYETGTLQHELLAGFVAAVEYLESLGWDVIVAHERELGARFLEGLPESVELYGLRTMEGRVPTFALNVPGRSPEEVARHLGDRGIFVWHGDYYAIEVMKRLELPDGAVRVGIVHYNTADEVDRLLDELAKLT